MLSRYAMDKQFLALGATHYHLSYYPAKPVTYYGTEYGARIFSVHYFNKEGTEIGMYIPDVSTKPQIFDEPRVWGIPHELAELKGY